ncbi:MAG: acylphosphatase [Aquisalimonadaceae bacterium]
MTGRITMHCHVSGRVQGVWFRGGAREQARALGIDGYARNLPDGRVDVLARGTPEAVAALLDWLRQGPPNAEVAELQHEQVDVIPDKGFRIL